MGSTLHQRQFIEFRPHEPVGDEFSGGRFRKGRSRLLGAFQPVQDRIGRRDMGEIVAAEIGDGKFAKEIIEDRSRVFDGVITLHEAGWLEASEGEGVDIFLERHAILETDRNRDGEVIHERAERGAFLVHVDEDFPQAAVRVFACSQIDLVTADTRLLGVALAAVRKTFAVLRVLHDFRDDSLSHEAGARRGV